MESHKRSPQVLILRTIRIITACLGVLLFATLLGAETVIAYRIKGDVNLFTVLQILTSAALGLIVLSAIAIKRVQKNHPLAVAALILASLYYLLYFIAGVYRLVMGGSLDVSFAWLNRDEIIATVANTLGGYVVWIFFLFLIALLVYALCLFYNAVYARAANGKSLSLANVILAGIVVMTVLLSFVGSLDSKPELYRFIGHAMFKRTSALETTYTKEYLAQLERSQNVNLPDAAISADLTILEERPNVIILHLESLNAAEVNTKNTPNFLRAAQEGILIPSQISQTVNTIRAEEVLLCSILPTPGDTITKQTDIPVPTCLPKILQQAGYRTAFFKSDDLSFASTGDFATLIGFESAHQKDIMKVSDREATWGFREDIFYKRAGEYISQNLQQPFFAYIAVSTTNHYPYEYPEGFHEIDAQNLPFSEPQNFAEEFSNAIFMQDAYLGTALEWLETSGLRDTSFIFITGDHPSPVVPNDRKPLLRHHAYENIFKTSAVLMPPRKLPHPFAVPKVYNHYLSHADITPTLLELAGIKPPTSQGVSAVEALTNNTELPHCIVSLQPFGDRYLSLVKYPKKTLYNFFEGTAQNFDLESDPEGIRPLTTRAIEDSDVQEFQSCVNS